MHGQAADLQVGDVLITEDGDEQPITQVTPVADGIRLWFEGETFYWLYKASECVHFRRGAK